MLKLGHVYPRFFVVVLPLDEVLSTSRPFPVANHRIHFPFQMVSEANGVQRLLRGQVATRTEEVRDGTALGVPHSAYVVLRGVTLLVRRHCHAPSAPPHKVQYTGT